MKFSSVQLSLGVSLLFHGAVAGVVSVVGVTTHNREPPTEIPEIVLSLVAAPATPSVPESQLVVADSPSLPEPPSTTPEAVQPITTPSPVEIETVSSEDVIAIPEPVSSAVQNFPPVPTVTPPLAQGDGSSAVPGRDATTVRTMPSVKAKPNYQKNPEPTYPLLARRRHQEGLVLLNVRVTAEGRAREIRLKQSSGYSLLDDAAQTAVMEWSFEPARIDSIPIESEIQVPVRFELTE